MGLIQLSLIYLRATTYAVDHATVSVWTFCNDLLFYYGIISLLVHAQVLQVVVTSSYCLNLFFYIYKTDTTSRSMTQGCPHFTSVPFTSRNQTHTFNSNTEDVSSQDQFIIDSFLFPSLRNSVLDIKHLSFIKDNKRIDIR